MIRLPANVVKAKQEFEEKNKIKDVVNNPRQLVQDTPFDVLFEYQNPQVAMLCQRKLLEYNTLALKLRTTIKGASPLINGVVSNVARLIGVYAKGLAMFPLINDAFFDSNTFGRLPINSGIPECLKETTKATQLITDVAKDVKSLFSKNNDAEIIDELISSLMKKTSTIDAILTGGLDTDEAKSIQILKTIGDALKLVQNATQRVLFSLFDNVSKFLLRTQLGRDIVRLRQMYDCLNSYCKPNIKYMVDMSDLMPDMLVQLPIDQYSGEFRPYRLNMYAKEYPELDGAEGSRVLMNMDADYINFCRQREEKTQEIANKNNVEIDARAWI